MEKGERDGRGIMNLISTRSIKQGRMEGVEVGRGLGRAGWGAEERMAGLCLILYCCHYMNLKN